MSSMTELLCLINDRGIGCVSLEHWITAQNKHMPVNRLG